MSVVFVYGTLTDPDRLSSVVDQYSLGPPAICEGFRRVDGEYPTLAPGRQTSGRLIETPEMDVLDSYEGLDRGLYCRVSVPLVAVPPTAPPQFAVETVEVYVGSPRLLGVDELIEWPSSGGLEHQITQYIESHPVRIHLDYH